MKTLTLLILTLTLSGCSMLRSACRQTQYVPAIGGGVREIPGDCPR